MIGRRSLREHVIKARSECLQNIKNELSDEQIIHAETHTNLSSPVYNRINTAPLQSHPIVNLQQTTPLETSIEKKDSIICSVSNTSEIDNHLPNGVNRLKSIGGRGVIMKQLVEELRLEKKESPKQMSQQNVNTVDLIGFSTILKNTDLQEEENYLIKYRVESKSLNGQYYMKQLESNNTKIHLKENFGIYEYAVEFIPAVNKRSDKFYLINRQFTVKSFDGNILCVPTMLQKNIYILMENLEDGTEIKMTIKFMRKKKLDDSVPLYNSLLHSVLMNLGFIKFEKMYCDPEKKISIDDIQFKLEIWPGFVTEIKILEDGLFLNCDVSHRILRGETVLETLTFIAPNKNYKDFKDKILTCLCGSTIITSNNHKTYQIDDIDFSMTPLSTFSQHGIEMSYIDYYKKVHGLEIHNYTQPMIITKPKNKNYAYQTLLDSQVCLVPELCKLTGLTVGMKNDRRLMALINMNYRPELQQHAVLDIVNRIYDNKNAVQILENWGISVHPGTVKLEGPIYEQENIILGKNVKIQVPTNMNWGPGVVKNTLFRAVNLDNWTILFTERESKTLKSFLNDFIICTESLGMSVKQPIPLKVGDSLQYFTNALYVNAKNITKLQLIVIIIPEQRRHWYNKIKQICCSELGIPSQVIISKTLSSNPSKLLSVMQKLALQINCKLGGANWAINIPMKNAMIVGIDVNHEMNHQISSVVGLVASMDQNFTKWCSVATNQKSTLQEISSSIQLSFNKVLMKYREMNDGVLPAKIIVYRDGVHENDIKAIKEYELKELEKSFETHPGNYNPMVTYIVVRKRINTKIYQCLNNKYVNPLAGTVIDNTITERNVFDFFLVSQNVLQGSADPTHYIVLQNGCNLAIKNVHRLTYKLCHLYYNRGNTINVPCAVQYAHQLANLIGKTIRIMPNEKLINTLYYL